MAPGDEPWWISFFAGAWGEQQEAGYPPERTRAEVDFMLRSLDLAPGARILDLPSGEGRHAIELTVRGYRVCGVDLNGRAVATARRRAQEAGLTVDFREGDMRSLVDEQQFDAVICFFGSFGYFSDDDNRRTAEVFARALRPGGRLLLDLQVAESLFPKFRERDWHWIGEPPDGPRILEERRWDLTTGRTETDWTFVSGNDVRTAHSSIRIYTCRELMDLLRSVGFREFLAYDPKTGGPFGMAGGRLALVAILGG